MNKSNRFLAMLFFAYSTAVMPSSGTTKQALNCEAAATIVELKGSVSIKPLKTIIRNRVEHTPMNLCPGDTVITFDGAAKIKANDYEISMDKNTTLNISEQLIEMERGAAFFQISPNKNHSSIKISTRLATIGVKGTAFMIKDSDEIVSVVMKEGEVSLSAINNETILFEATAKSNKSSQNVKKEFEEFMKKQTEDYGTELENYHAWLNEQEKQFVGFLDNMILDANSQLSIHEDSAYRSVATPDNLKELNRIENLF